MKSVRVAGMISVKNTLVDRRDNKYIGICNDLF